MQKITPYLWFDSNLKEITDYYLSVFPEATLHTNGTLSDTPSGEVELATLTIFGQELNLMTAGPMFKFTEAISFMIHCDTQEEIDYYWEKLSAVPDAEQCGWCKDKYGLSWQVAPTALEEMLACGDKKKVASVTQAFLKMKKFHISLLEEAFNNPQ
ncbi:MAG TPA: VOC family protein [Candidatus Paceibacterota bacterium]|nr:VOC family protein [Candidatus Paceibacterota bacterium]